MSQYDAILGYSSLSTCLADPIIQQHLDDLQGFLSDHVFSDIKVWRASQDVINGDGSITHNFLAGYFLLVSWPTLILSLRNNTAIKVVTDRDLANAGLPGAIIRSTVSNAVLQDLRFEPVPMGANYPWGNWQ